MPILFVPGRSAARVTPDDGTPATTVRLQAGEVAASVVSVPWGIGTRHLLIAAGTKARVNGQPFLHVRFLGHRDEITGITACPVFYSTQGPLAVALAPVGVMARCRLCGDAVTEAAVLCPTCKRWYHQDCWSSGPLCPTTGCGHPTDPDLVWRPAWEEPLEYVAIALA